MCSNLDGFKPTALARQCGFGGAFHPAFERARCSAVHHRAGTEGHAGDRAHAHGVFDPAPLQLARDATYKFALQGDVTVGERNTDVKTTLDGIVESPASCLVGNRVRSGVEFWVVFSPA